MHIRVEDLHLDDESPQIHLTHAKRQACSCCYVPVLPALAQELRTHLQGRRQGYLFESNRHTLYSVRTVQAVVKRFALQAGIAKRVYPHLLRHSIATILLDSGFVPIDQVQKFLGHLQLSTTQIYAETSTRALGENYVRALAARQPELSPIAPAATTVPVEQESSAARLEAAEQLPETLDPESLRKYFTLTETTCKRSPFAAAWSTSSASPCSSAPCVGKATSWATLAGCLPRCSRPSPVNWASWPCRSRLPAEREDPLGTPGAYPPAPAFFNSAMISSGNGS